ncbi:hypothetical protein [Streptomyces sp. NPDC088736]|uniref:hypothetical protein n=1 Tax=Streptomyces sp. NPDC088736 TaxID=3365881 RepID=UPI00380396BF
MDLADAITLLLDQIAETQRRIADPAGARARGVLFTQGPWKLDQFTLLIDKILLIDLDATRKQRHAVTSDLPPSDQRALLVRGVALTT